MLSRRRFLASLLALCAGVTRAQAAAQLTVSAAASLTDVMRELGKRFEERNANILVRFNFGASGALLQQIANGAPVDVFVSADEDTVERGIAQKVLASDTRREIATNSLVLVTPNDAQRLTSLAGLTDDAIKRIAIGKPVTVPAGRYAQQALQTAGLWTTLVARLVYADNVRQVLDYVSRGEVDAGFVYATDAALMRDRVRVATIVEGHSPIRYPAIVTADTRRHDLAVAFIDFLRTREARDRFVAVGFGPPGQ
ncbi:MAG: molybdate ABC transporter substrate-binding protein [Burkholderiaceae bacterium]